MKEKQQQISMKLKIWFFEKIKLINLYVDS